MAPRKTRIIQIIPATGWICVYKDGDSNVELALHNVACVMTGAVFSNKAGGFQRQIFITTERGEKLALMLYADRRDDLCARETDARFPNLETAEAA